MFVQDRKGFRDGLIFIEVVRCMAMVLISFDLLKGDGDYYAVLDAFKSMLPIELFASFAFFSVTVASHSSYEVDVSHGVVTRRALQVFFGIALAAAILTRLIILRLLSEPCYRLYYIRSVAIFPFIGLIFTIIVLLFTQEKHVVKQITSVLRVCPRMMIYFPLFS